MWVFINTKINLTQKMTNLVYMIDVIVTFGLLDLSNLVVNVSSRFTVICMITFLFFFFLNLVKFLSPF